MSSKSRNKGLKKTSKAKKPLITYRMLDDDQKHILNQMHFDAFCIAINECLHVGQKRIEEVAACYLEALNEISQTMVDNDADVYMERIDKRLKPIIPPDRWMPWAVRYKLER